MSSSSGTKHRETIRPVSPQVSVIIATYNWSSVLPYSIGSVLRQSVQDFEILVVGDGCTDDSEQALIDGVTPSFFGSAESTESKQVTAAIL
jgi:cellulose synthase/poly-beta-1,6-N-acetylglucosamine synthase-like glycosyltransferase